MFLLTESIDQFAPLFDWTTVLAKQRDSCRAAGPSLDLKVTCRRSTGGMKIVRGLRGRCSDLLVGYSI